jgi:hypothetical protein
MGQEWRQGPDGILRLIDTETGHVLAQQATKRSNLASPKTGKRHASGRPLGRKPADVNATHHWILDGNGRKHWVPKGMNPDQIPQVVHPYCEVTVDHILRFVTEGKTLTQVSKIPGMPPVHTVFKWLRKYPEFKSQMNEARKARAEYYADKAIDTAELTEEDKVQSDRLKTDTYKWAAEVNDRETYGKQTKLTGNVGSVNLTIVTGVPQPQVEEAPAIAVESTPVPSNDEQGSA